MTPRAPCRTSLRSGALALIAGLFTMTTAASLEAQVSRDWSVCYTGGVGACTDIWLTTTPTMGGVGGSRNGTTVSLMLRQNDGPFASGLLSFHLGFDLFTSEQSGMQYMMPTAVGGAVAGAVGPRWYLSAIRSSDPSWYNTFFGGTEADPSKTPHPTAWIGGCFSPSSNAYWQVDNVTCGSGQAMTFQWTTSVFFDADAVTTVGTGVFAIDPQSLYRGYGGAYCDGPSAGGDGIGYDGYDPSNVNACVVSSAQPLNSTVPEPGSFALVAGALGLLGVQQRRRRTRRQDAGNLI